MSRQRVRVLPGVAGDLGERADCQWSCIVTDQVEGLVVFELSGEPEGVFGERVRPRLVESGRGGERGHDALPLSGTGCQSRLG